MKEKTIPLLWLAIAILAILLGFVAKETSRLQREIEGYSDQVMELERMLEGR